MLFELNKRFLYQKTTTPCNLDACLGYYITMLNLPKFKQIIPIFKNYILKISIYLAQKKNHDFLTLKPLPLPPGKYGNSC